MIILNDIYQEHLDALKKLLNYIKGGIETDGGYDDDDNGGDEINRYNNGRNDKNNYMYTDDKNGDETNYNNDIDIKKTKEPRRIITKKIGRNEPCPCGSGKKYKQCHGT